MFNSMHVCIVQVLTPKCNYGKQLISENELDDSQ